MRIRAGFGKPSSRKKNFTLIAPLPLYTRSYRRTFSWSESLRNPRCDDEAGAGESRSGEVIFDLQPRRSEHFQSYDNLFFIARPDRYKRLDKRDGGTHIVAAMVDAIT